MDNYWRFAPIFNYSSLVPADDKPIMKKEENNQNAISRRSFITQASVISATMIAPWYVMGCKSPSDEITLGFIGTGKQAMDLQDFFTKTGEVRILAAADVYEGK